MKKVPREYKLIIDPFLRNGDLTLVEGRHTCVVAASGHKQPIPGTVSDRRSLQNWQHHFKVFLNKANIEDIRRSTVNK